MKTRGLTACAALLCVAASVTGCSTLDRIVGRGDDWQAWTPDRTALQIAQSGRVTETILDTLDESYYNADELQDMIARSVREYNSEHTDSSVTVPEYSAENGQVRLVLVYRTPEDYASYNQVSFFDGPMLDVQMSGITFPNEFRKVSGAAASADTVSSDEALSHKEYSVAVADADHVIEVPGQICYLSLNAEPVNSHVARPADRTELAETEAERAGLVLPSNAVYYGTEKEEKADSGTDTAPAEQMFIIYEEDPEPST